MSVSERLQKEVNSVGLMVSGESRKEGAGVCSVEDEA